MRNDSILKMVVFFLLMIVLPLSALSKTELSEGTSSEDEARKYFRAPQKGEGEEAAAKARVVKEAAVDRYFAIHLGSFISSDSYQWGASGHLNSVGRLNIGFTYGLGSFGSFADWVLNGDFIGYELPEGKPVQIAVVPLIVFPEAGSKFPLYFGVGLGPGFFFNQIPQESFLSLNYQLIAGARMFDVVENTGFFIEGGIKNHILLLSDGQFLGYFLAVGAIFTF